MRIELNLVGKKQKAIIIEPSFVKTPLIVVSTEHDSTQEKLSAMYVNNCNTLHKNMHQLMTPQYLGERVARVTLLQFPRARYFIETNIPYFLGLCIPRILPASMSDPILQFVLERGLGR